RSPMRARFRAAFGQFIDVRLKSDEEVARLVRDLEVDIAVDMSGHTAEGRPGVLAFRPAPLQVNYLGYPGTMGADFVDYIIADDYVVPAEAREFYSEKVVWLPDSYQANDATRHISERTPSRGEAGLPEQGFIFCSLNNSFKISPD